jgi:serine/threonine-protein kinase
MDTLLQVLEVEPAPPRLLNARIERDLETICLKCLEKDPRRRYPSAQALAADLGRFLEGESISLASVNLVDRVARALTRSKYDAAFGAWGSILLWFAPLVLLGEVGIWLHALDGPPYSFAWGAAIRVVQFLLMGAVLWRYRRVWKAAAGAVQRQMATIWIGFFIACHLAAAVNIVLTPPGQPVEVLVIYPYLALISGFTFFILGGSHWGYCFLFAGAFFLLALLMPLGLRAAPLEFGLLWGACLVTIGIRLRRLGGGAPRELSQSGGR